MSTLPTSPRRPRSTGSTDPSHWDRFKKDAYINAFYGAVLDTLKRNGSRKARAVAGDVAGFGVTRLMGERFEEKSRIHTDPIRYGRSAAVNLFYDWLRREAVARGEGARRTAKVLSFDAWEGFDVLDGSIEGTRAAIAAADLERLERIILQYVSARDWAIYCLVHRHGWTTVAVGELYNLRRETISRIIRDVKETLAVVLA